MVQGVDELDRVFAHLQHAPVRGADEALVDQVIEEADQLAVEAVDLQQAQGLAVVAQLPPGPDLEQFLQGAQSARQGNEAKVEQFLRDAQALTTEAGCGGRGADAYARALQWLLDQAQPQRQAA